MKRFSTSSMAYAYNMITHIMKTNTDPENNRASVTITNRRVIDELPPKITKIVKNKFIFGDEKIHAPYRFVTENPNKEIYLFLKDKNVHNEYSEGCNNYINYYIENSMFNTIPDTVLICIKSSVFDFDIAGDSFEGNETTIEDIFKTYFLLFDLVLLDQSNDDPKVEEITIAAFFTTLFFKTQTRISNLDIIRYLKKSLPTIYNLEEVVNKVDELLNSPSSISENLKDSGLISASQIPNKVFVACNEFCNMCYIDK